MIIHFFRLFALCMFECVIIIRIKYNIRFVYFLLLHGGSRRAALISDLQQPRILFRVSYNIIEAIYRLRKRPKKNKCELFKRTYLYTSTWRTGRRRRRHHFPFNSHARAQKGCDMLRCIWKPPAPYHAKISIVGNHHHHRQFLFFFFYGIPCSQTYISDQVCACKQTYFYQNKLLRYIYWEVYVLLCV